MKGSRGSGVKIRTCTAQCLVCPPFAAIGDKNQIYEDVFNPFPNKPWFVRVCSRSLFEKTVGKGEIARNEQFLLFPQCFLPVWITFCHFHQYKMQAFSVWKGLKFVVWERVNFINSYLPFPQKSIRSEIAKLFSISIL